MNDEKSEATSIEVEVYSPRKPDPKEFEWNKTLKVEAAVEDVLDAFDYESGTTATLQDAEEEEPFDSDKTLVAAGVVDDDVLELIDDGGGV